MKRCPECGGMRIWCDGVRQTATGPVQRFLCRSCGFRFSQTTAKSQVQLNVSSQASERSKSHNDLPHDVVASLNLSPEKPVNNLPFFYSEDVGSHKRTILGQKLNNLRNCNSTRLVCVSESEAKNLATVETPKEKAQRGATAKPLEADIKGKIFEVAWHLKKEGYSSSAIHCYPKVLELLARYGANLYDPEDVKAVISRRETWGSASKLLAVTAYTLFAKLNGIYWTPPRYKLDQKLPFIPLESELDTFISAAGKKISAVLQTLKETGMRIGEACRLKWIDVDLEHGTITINQPEKHGLPRMFKISGKLVAMLNALPRKNEYLFGGMIAKNAASYFCQLKKRIANKLQNPRLLSIHLHTFRHWHATMEYHKTKDILHVMKQLGHRKIENTLIYTQLIQFESDDYHSAVAENIDEAKKLIEAGFEYVCTHESHMLFRKRK